MLPLVVAAVVTVGRHSVADFVIGDVVDSVMGLVEHEPADSVAVSRLVAVAHTLYSFYCF